MNKPHPDAIPYDSDKGYQDPRVPKNFYLAKDWWIPIEAGVSGPAGKDGADHTDELVRMNQHIANLDQRLFDAESSITQLNGEINRLKAELEPVREEMRRNNGEIPRWTT